MPAIFPLRAFIRHLMNDLQSRVGLRHYLVDLHRFLKICQSNSNQQVSIPPHPLKLYRQLLKDLQNNQQCIFRSMIDHVRKVPADPQRVNVVLRHDLDAGDPGVALALCRVESELGLRSSVHILVDGTSYDPARLAPLARTLHSEGFDVGLHTQAWKQEDYEVVFRHELRRFEELFKFPPQTFSQHGAWPRTDLEMAWRHQFTHRTPELIKETPIIGYNNTFDWVSEDSNIAGKPVPVLEKFFQLSERCYLGGTALILTHDNHWQVD